MTPIEMVEIAKAVLAKHPWIEGCVFYGLATKHDQGNAPVKGSKVRPKAKEWNKEYKTHPPMFHVREIRKSGLLLCESPGTNYCLFRPDQVDVAGTEDCLEVEYLNQTFYLFGKDDKFWFENPGGNSSLPFNDCKSAFISLLVFAFEWRLRSEET